MSENGHVEEEKRRSKRILISVSGAVDEVPAPANERTKEKLKRRSKSILAFSSTESVPGTMDDYMKRKKLELRQALILLKKPPVEKPKPKKRSKLAKILENARKIAADRHRQDYQPRSSDGKTTRYCCPTCGKHFKSSSGFVGHIERGSENCGRRRKNEGNKSDPQTCAVCLKNFAGRCTLRNHMNKSHQHKLSEPISAERLIELRERFGFDEHGVAVELQPKVQKDRPKRARKGEFHCPVCQQVFAFKSGLHRHCVKQHGKTMKELVPSSTGSVHCALCPHKTFSKLKQLCQHVAASPDHHYEDGLFYGNRSDDLRYVVREVKFENEGQFEKFLRRFECNMGGKMKKRQRELLKSGLCMYKNMYNCILSCETEDTERNFLIKQENESKKRRVKKKRNMHCTAFIRVHWMNDGKVKTTYCVDHYKHELMSCFAAVPLECRLEIRRLLEDGASFHKILAIIRRKYRNLLDEEGCLPFDTNDLSRLTVTYRLVAHRQKLQRHAKKIAEANKTRKIELRGPVAGKSVEEKFARNLIEKLENGVVSGPICQPTSDDGDFGKFVPYDQGFCGEGLETKNSFPHAEHSQQRPQLERVVEERKRRETLKLLRMAMEKTKRGCSAELEDLHSFAKEILEK